MQSEKRLITLFTLVFCVSFFSFADNTALTEAIKHGDLHAVKQLVREIEDIDEECIANNLYTAGLVEPDLLIRTANEMRVSNFLLWQISYTEFYVTDVFWPDFKEAELDLAIKTYAERNRRFGALDIVE